MKDRRLVRRYTPLVGGSGGASVVARGVAGFSARRMADGRFEVNVSFQVGQTVKSLTARVQGRNRR